MTKATTKTPTTKIADETIEQVTKTQAQAKSFFGNLMEAGKLAFNGTIEIDKVILGHIGSTAKGALDHGRSVLSAKDVRTAIEIQTAFVTNSFEQGFANTKEIVELAQVRTKEVVSTFKKAA